jgi:carbonic anhydrase
MLSQCHILLAINLIISITTTVLDYSETDWVPTCRNGTRQSPLDLNQQINYTNSQTYITLVSSNYAKLVNTSLMIRNDRTYALDASGLGTLIIKKNGIPYKYNLADIHLHWKSEHRINSYQYDFEVHLVHEKDISYNKNLTFPDPDIDNNLLVVSILHDSRKNEPNQLIALMNIKDQAPATLDIAQFYSINEGFYHYLGSLTTPGCTEAVNWIVLDTPRNVTTDQVKILEDWVSKLYPKGNSRAVEPLNNRQVYRVTARNNSESKITLSRFIYVTILMVLFS